MTIAPVRLDPLQRLVDISFGNRIAVIYGHAGRVNAVVPPQVIMAVTAPVGLTLVNTDLVLGAVGVGSGEMPTVGERITGSMLRAYSAWRYQSVELYSVDHIDRVGIHCAVVLNLAKFDNGPATLGVSISANGVGGNFTLCDMALTTYRNATGVRLPTEGSGNAFADGIRVGSARSVGREPGSVTGSIDLRTLAVTLSGSSAGPGPGSGGPG